MELPVDEVLDLTPPERWSNFRSYDSKPLTHITLLASRIHPVSVLQIPRRIWAVLLRHPEVIAAYARLQWQPAAASDPCPTCGVMRQACVPPLDRQVFERLLQASLDGPILPGAVTLIDVGLDEVRMASIDPPRRARIINALGM